MFHKIKGEVYIVNIIENFDKDKNLDDLIEEYLKLMLENSKQ